MTDKVFLIDSGHGGIIDGRYMTAPKKMYVFDDGTQSLEGVINRAFKHRLFKHMDREGIPYIDICPTNLDMELDERVDIVNRLYREYYQRSVLVSIHNNASPNHNAGGSEVWTSVGETLSDRHARLYYESWLREFGEDESFRTDSYTGQPDKESMFYILKWTRCPAFLPEIDFFDFRHSFDRLINPVFQERWCQMMIDYMRKAILTAGIW